MRRLLLLFCALAPSALAHRGEPLAPHDLWSAWSLDPGIIISLAISAWLYARGVASPARGLRRWEISAFACGWLALLIALVSPLHPLGEALFSAHMAQHELIMVVAAPLLVLGRPLVAFLWGMPVSWRRALGQSVKAPAVQRVWRALTRPLVAWSISAVVLWVWHAPALFQAALRSDAVHTLQHISFLGSSLLFWWALMRSMSCGGAVVHVFTTAVHTSVLGALLTFAPSIWYPAYAATAGTWGLTPLEDQQLAGLIMWVPPSVAYIAAGLALFALWLRQSDLRAVIASTVIALMLFGCSAQRHVEKAAAVISGGNPHRGRDVIQYYGCPACHTIRGVPNAHGLVGPPLTGFASRVYIAGMLPNTTGNLIRWIQNPKRINERTAMPNMNVTAADARDIAGYLYTLK